MGASNDPALQSNPPDRLIVDIAKMYTEEINRYAARSREAVVVFGTICLATVGFLSKNPSVKFNLKILIFLGLAIACCLTWLFIRTSGIRGRYSKIQRQAVLRQLRIGGDQIVEFSGDLINVEMDYGRESKLHDNTWGIIAIYRAFVVLLMVVSGGIILLQ